MVIHTHRNRPAHHANSILSRHNNTSYEQAYANTSPPSSNQLPPITCPQSKTSQTINSTFFPVNAPEIPVRQTLRRKNPPPPPRNYTNLQLDVEHTCLPTLRSNPRHSHKTPNLRQHALLPTRKRRLPRLPRHHPHDQTY